MRATARFVTRSVRAVRYIATDRRIPWPLRWLVVLGAMPVPGPFDEALLLIAAVPLFVFYRPLMREAWARASPERTA